MPAIAKIRPLSDARRLADFIGLDRAGSIDDLGLVDRVAKGFPVRTVSNVVKKIDPEGRFMRETDIIPKSTLHRRERDRKPLSKDESERILALSMVFAETLRLYHVDSAKAAQYLRTPHPMLGGKTPMDLAVPSIAGAELVLKLLAQADAGVAA